MDTIYTLEQRMLENAKRAAGRIGTTGKVERKSNERKSRRLLNLIPRHSSR